MNKLRTDAINSALEASLSRERLSECLQDCGGVVNDALSLYERNTRLSEAFYSSLQCMEICFRNKLSLQLSLKYGDNWINSNGCPLLADSRGEAQRVVGEIKKQSPTLHDIIAELNLGFWVGLLGPRYDRTLWRECLYRSFRADGPKKRAIVHRRFNALRRFRNQIAHHEPIFHVEVEQFHTEIIEAIGWMCSDTSAWASYHSRFLEVYNGRAI